MSKKEVKKTAGAKPMKKAQLFESLAQSLEITKKQARTYIEELRNLIQAELKRAGTFTLPDLGKFNMKERKARMGRNPATGESIKIGAKMSLKFRVAKAMKDACLPPKVDKKKKK